MSKNEFICDCNVIHKDVVDKTINQMPEQDIFNKLAEFFKILGDTTRVKILFALDKNEMCVCDIANLLGMHSSAISHQLRILKQARLIKNRREGKSVIYSLSDGHVRTIIDQGMEHVSEKYTGNQKN